MWWRPLGPIGARGAALWWMVCVREDGVRAKSVRDHLQTRAHNTRRAVCVEHMRTSRLFLVHVHVA